MKALIAVFIILAAAAVLSSTTPTTQNIVTTPVVTNTVQPKSIPREYNLSGYRIVYVYGVIGEGLSATVAKQILQLGKTGEPITILINSPGGSVLDGAEIISAMEAAKGPVNTICVELCASMAAMIHSYGHKRLMLDRSIVMYHPASGGLEGEVDKMYSRLSTLKRYVDKLDANVAKRAKLTPEEFRNLYMKELWLDAEDATQQGFADGIVFVRGESAAKLYPDMSILLKNKPGPVGPTVNNPFKLNWF